MNDSFAARVSGVTHCYGSRKALDDVSLRIERGEMFGFLGPNGGGKTTLFRLLSTLIPPQQGELSVLGWDVRRQVREIRSRIGVVFQAPSLDKKLTVRENLHHQGHLYGLHGQELRRREEELLGTVGLSDRAGELVEQLSGGLRRRAELAKGLLHRPELILLDEPTTGLDPAARADLWNYLARLRQAQGVSVIFTTHLLEEAEKADRLAILHQGKLVALDTPEQLRATVGGDSLLIETGNPAELVRRFAETFQQSAAVIDGRVRLEQPDGHRWVARLVEAFPGAIDSITLGKPTLEDVFIARTGHRFWGEGSGEEVVTAGRRPSHGK